jgi:uncharacterized protein YbjT (DUF2867 family)
MSNEAPIALILGGTGRTGSLLAGKLARRGIATRAAARRGAGVRFDWDDPATHADALAGVDRLYLVTPVLRVSYAEQVAGFLDLAESAGVRHVTFLSTYNADQAPEGIDIAAVEAGLAARQAVTHSILRPAWVMQNFTDDHLPVAGPQALTFGEAADIIASVSGRPVRYNDIDQEAWISGALAAGVPADYAVMLRWLTGAIITGHGSTPTDDVEKVTGRKPATFREFAERNARAWTVEAK